MDGGDDSRLLDQRGDVERTPHSETDQDNILDAVGYEQEPSKGVSGPEGVGDKVRPSGSMCCPNEFGWGARARSEGSYRRDGDKHVEGRVKSRSLVALGTRQRETEMGSSVSEIWAAKAAEDRAERARERASSSLAAPPLSVFLQIAQLTGWHQEA